MTTTILVVDDEEPVRDFLAQLLEEDGHLVLTAIHGARALELINEQTPDLVISDVMMPILSGAELTRRLKANPATATIPVILMSSAGRRAADGTGADAFIAKPFDLTALEELVERLLPPAR